MSSQGSLKDGRGKRSASIRVTGGGDSATMVDFGEERGPGAKEREQPLKARKGKKERFTSTP